MKISTPFTAALVAVGALSIVPTAMAREAGETQRQEDRRSTVGDDHDSRANRSQRVETGDDRSARGTERGDDRVGRGRGTDERSGRGR